MKFDWNDVEVKHYQKPVRKRKRKLKAKAVRKQQKHSRKANR